MDKADRLGFGVAITAHVVVLAALSFGLLARPRPIPKAMDTMDVQLTDLVGLRSTAPVVSTEEASSSEAPEIGKAEEAAPAAPEPVPTPPAPKPTPPPPAPPSKTPPKPEPKPVAEKPAPEKAKPTPPAKSRTPLDDSFLKSVRAEARREGGSGKAEKTTGSRLGKDFLKDVVQNGRGKADAPRAAVGQAAMNGLGAAIKRQVQPCYERKGLVGPGGERIRTVLRLRFNPDGTLEARPTVSEQTGLDEQNGRYAKRAAEVAIAAVMECTPLKLPAELYKGGWEDIEPTFSQIGN
ncbi:hypothetical protein PQ455_12620 [Sphingomonas naphthae]|uniref:Cell envelope biogenesis protein TolA n=1 Tax=Sphingomonas naphthae TaxID=1813468 RepID=A0ABY7TJ85_9SPHN|nr:hypothetical protein [Sphingomonas naphthae]WCT72475.1 hypothetical protein PQ455_12620 [Sphingomonas naphthae]